MIFSKCKIRIKIEKYRIFLPGGVQWQNLLNTEDIYGSFLEHFALHITMIYSCIMRYYSDGVKCIASKFQKSVLQN